MTIEEIIPERLRRKYRAEITEEEENHQEGPEPINFRITEVLSKDLTDEEKELLVLLKDFLEELSRKFKANMELLMDEYKQNNPNFKTIIKHKMKEKGYDLPWFTIYDSNQGNQFVKDNELPLYKEKLGPGEFLVVFNLPPPLARFWYRGGTRSWGTHAEEIPEGNIEWGHFYREALPVIWEETDDISFYGQIGFDRVNGIGQHDPKKYYYVWTVKKQRIPLN